MMELCMFPVHKLQKRQKGRMANPSDTGGTEPRNAVGKFRRSIGGGGKTIAVLEARGLRPPELEGGWAMESDSSSESEESPYICRASISSGRNLQTAHKTMEGSLARFDELQLRRSSAPAAALSGTASECSAWPLPKTRNLEVGLGPNILVPGANPFRHKPSPSSMTAANVTGTVG
ncbi:hypothetical protein AXG93_2175s1780 [Marchantia polymorpha subsp. ruderalis]|uniref:Uncharacterized protein n=1 Tax=Marchantia polymorpha subsp. ruderalis TaxID=1480154 RepID=A0A176W6H9_MARPO|nr:hypothetical protein AXG93_2175s1780 [Marchantia polymorpha subsp. ruderalis]